MTLVLSVASLKDGMRKWEDIISRSFEKDLAFSARLHLLVRKSPTFHSPFIISPHLSHLTPLTSSIWVFFSPHSRPTGRTKLRADSASTPSVLTMGLFSTAKPRTLSWSQWVNFPTAHQQKSKSIVSPLFFFSLRLLSSNYTLAEFSPSPLPPTKQEETLDKLSPLILNS